MTGSLSDRFHVATDRAATGGPERYHDQLRDRGKLFVRDRVDLLCDPGSFVEDGLLANAETEDHGADAVVTGRGTIDGRPMMVIANDPTVEAGSWGRLTVEKIIRALEAAYDELAGLAREGRIVAIGEVGLDYHYDSSPRPVQQAVFRRPLDGPLLLKPTTAPRSESPTKTDPP